MVTRNTRRARENHGVVVVVVVVPESGRDGVFDFCFRRFLALLPALAGGDFVGAFAAALRLEAAGEALSTPPEAGAVAPPSDASLLALMVDFSSSSECGFVSTTLIMCGGIESPAEEEVGAAMSLWV
jgi:hypothetical protein